MKALVIAANAVRRLLRDRSNIFFVLIFPMGLILILGISFGGAITPRLGILTGLVLAALIRRDATLVDVLPQIGVLLAYAAVLLLVAVWRHRRTPAG